MVSLNFGARMIIFTCLLFTTQGLAEPPLLLQHFFGYQDADTRSAAMGGVFVVLNGSAISAWNPACLATIEYKIIKVETGLCLRYGNWVGERAEDEWKENWISTGPLVFAIPIRKICFLLGSQPVSAYGGVFAPTNFDTLTGIPINNRWRCEGVVGSRIYAIGFPVTPSLAFGISCNNYDELMSRVVWYYGKKYSAKHDGNGWGIEVGMLYSPFPKMNLALLFRPKTQIKGKWMLEEEGTKTEGSYTHDMPHVIIVGASKEWINKVILAFQLDYFILKGCQNSTIQQLGMTINQEDVLSFHFGTEYMMRPSIPLRIGFRAAPYYRITSFDYDPVSFVRYASYSGQNWKLQYEYFLTLGIGYVSEHWKIDVSLEDSGLLTSHSEGVKETKIKIGVGFNF